MPRKRNEELFHQQHVELREVILKLGRFNKKYLEDATAINRRMITDHVVKFVKDGEIYAENEHSRKTYYPM